MSVCFHVSVQTNSRAACHGDGFYDISFRINDAFAPAGACHFHAEGMGDTAVTAVVDGACGTALVAGNEEYCVVTNCQSAMSLLLPVS